MTTQAQTLYCCCAATLVLAAFVYQRAPFGGMILALVAVLCAAVAWHDPGEGK